MFRWVPAPRGSSGKKILLPLQEMQEMRGPSLGGEDSLEEEMKTHSNVLAWEIMNRGAWQATVHGASKSQHN